jgi:hypothetical protein
MVDEASRKMAERLVRAGHAARQDSANY